MKAKWDWFSLSQLKGFNGYTRRRSRKINLKNVTRFEGFVPIAIWFTNNIYLLSKLANIYRASPMASSKIFLFRQIREWTQKILPIVSLAHSLSWILLQGLSIFGETLFTPKLFFLFTSFFLPCLCAWICSFYLWVASWILLLGLYNKVVAKVVERE